MNAKIIPFRKSKKCGDECPFCLYIGDGDFICTKYDELVITDWMSINEESCIDDIKKSTEAKYGKRC